MKRKSLVLSLLLAANVIAGQPQLAVAQSAPQNPARQLFNDGRELFDDGKFTDAERKFREALSKYPKADQSDRTAFYLIKSLVKQGRVQEARAEIDNFSKNYPASRWNQDLRELTAELTPEAKLAAERAVSQALGSTDLPSNAGLQAEMLRQLISMYPDRGIENARNLLKKDPSDPTVVANLGTIYLSKSPEALPFLLDLSMNGNASPKTRENAFFWASRKNLDKEQVAQDLIERLKKKENESLVSEALFRMTFDEHRQVLEHIVLSSDPTKFSAIEKIYRGGSITLRTDLVQYVAKLEDPMALAFVLDVAQNDKDVAVRNAAIQAVVHRRDMSDAKAIEGIILKAPPVRMAAPK